MRNRIVFAIFLILLTSMAFSEEIDGIPIRTWETEDERIEERKELKNKEATIYRWYGLKLDAKQLRINSAIIPGLGQYKKQQYVKAGFFSVLSIGGVLVGRSYLKSAKNSYNSYKDADDIKSIEKYWDETQSNQNIGLSLLAIGIATWAYNIWEVGHGVEKENQELFEKMMLSYNGNKIKLAFSF